MAFKENLTLDAEVRTRVDPAAIHDIAIALMHAGDEAKAYWEQIFTGKPVEQVLRTRWETDTSGISKLKSELKATTPVVDQLVGMSKKKLMSEEGSVTKLRQQVNTYTQMRDGIAKIDKDTGRVSQRWLEADANVKKAAMGLAQAQGSIMGMAKIKIPFLSEFLSFGNTLNQIGAIIGTVTSAFQALSAAFQPFIDRAKQVESFKLSLAQFVPTMEQVDVAFNNAKAISMELGLSLAQVEKGYKRMTPTIMAAGGSMGDVDETMQALGARTTILGLNSEQAGRYFEAFAQVMGKGTLQSEELNQQFSELDGALRSQLATYFAMNEGIYNLSDAMADGEISATMFREAFVAMNTDSIDQLREKVIGVTYAVTTLGDQGGVTIQQLENMKNTLSGITMENLVEQTNGFGKSIQAIGLHWEQFLASSSEHFKAIGWAFEGILDILGGFFEIASHILGFLAKVVTFSGEILLTLTLIGPLLALVGKVVQFAASGFRAWADLINPIDTQMQKIASGQEEVKDLTQMTNQEAQIYVAILVKAQQEAEKLKEAAKERFDFEAKRLEELQKKMNDLYKEEQDRIKESISLLKEKETAIKEEYATKIEKEKEHHNRVMQNLKDQLKEVQEKYKKELDAVNVVTWAEKEQKRLRKQKLEAILKSAEATYQEKVDALVQLETMKKQEQVQAIQQRQLEEEKKIKEQMAAEEKEHKAIMEQLQREQKAALGEIKTAINELTTALKQNQQEQKEANKKIKSTLDLTDEQVESIDQINEKIENQKTLVDGARNEYLKVKNQVDQITEAIKLAAQEQAKFNEVQKGAEYNSNPGASKTNVVGRFAGGPVTGGRTYTVNELGVEGFLNSAGRLSEIKAPAWGQWTAPGTGTVIPAGIYAAIKAGQASQVGFSGANIAARAKGNADLVRAIQGLPGGGSMTNNVTVQAANPSRAASDMLVALTRIRRRRYS